MSIVIKIKKLFSLRLKQEGIFTDKMIFDLVFPVFIQQVMSAVIKITDTIMVSYVGEAAVAGISFITTLDNLVNNFLFALAIGGSVVVSQYIGRNDLEKGCDAVKNMLYSIVPIAIVACLIMFAFQIPILQVLLGAVEKDVFQSAQIYFSLALFSYPFYAMFYTASAVLRAMRDTRLVMLCTVSMLALNLALKVLLIYVLKLGVLGAGVSMLTSAAVVGIIMVIMLCNTSRKVHVKNIFQVELDFKMIKRILSVGVPNGIENGLFQFGQLTLQRLTATFGTVALAANAIVKELNPISFVITKSFQNSIVTIVGQCMGAGEQEEAAMYTKHILKVCYILSLFVNLVCIVFNPQLVSLFGLSSEVNEIASSIFYVYCIGAIFFYPTSYMLPNALRGAGDTKYTMVVSMMTMFGLRIGMAYVLGQWLGLGLLGIWLAMQIDWIARSAFFVGRFLRGKWKSIKVI